MSKTLQRLSVALVGIVFLPVAALAQTAPTGTHPGFSRGGLGGRPAVSGTVAAVSGTTLTVTSTNGTAYTVDASAATIIKRPTTPPAAGTTPPAATIADIAVGDTVAIVGTVNGTNVTATRVMDGVMTSRNTTPPAATGTVASLNGTSITLTGANGTTYTVDASNATIIKRPTTPPAAGTTPPAATISDIAVGDTLSVSGTVSGSNITATRVMDGVMMGRNGGPTTQTMKVPKAPKPKPVKPSLTSGTVSSIDGNTVTLTGKDGNTYTLDASKIKPLRRLGGALQLGDIHAGDTLNVNGIVSGGTIAPTSLRDNSLEAKSLAYVGTVTALNGSSFTLQTKAKGNLTVNTDTTTAILMNGKTDAIADLAVGQTVTVTGALDTASQTVTATKVNMVIHTLAITVRGTVQSVSGSTLTVLDKSNVTYTVDTAKAHVQYQNGRKAADLTIVQTGDSVTVTGKHQSASDNVTASVVRDLTQVYKAS